MKLPKGLKEYIIKMVRKEDNSCEDLLGSNEALKDFAKIWEHEAELKIVLAMIEYNFKGKRDYSDRDITVLKHVLGKIGLFFQDCNREMKAHKAKKL
jgi:hypothetical protein